MIIRAARPDSGFLIVRNEVIRDDRLSLKARGLLLLILSYPDNWKTDSENLAAACKEGRTAILSALKELRDVGYMRQTKSRDDKGHITTATYIYDYPESENLTPVPTRGNSASPLVAPEAGFPESGEPTPKEEPTKKTEELDRANVSSLKARKKPAKSRPVGWQPSKQHRNFAVRFGIDIDQQADLFMAYHDSKAQAWARPVESVRPRGMPSTW
jgi:hypothetical protein